MSVRKKANKKLKEAQQLNPELITELLTLLNEYIARQFLTLEFFNVLALKPNSLLCNNTPVNFFIYCPDYKFADFFFSILYEIDTEVFSEDK